jgi:4-hydroxythreonine-4-phosphate dehydrogenase
MSAKSIVVGITHGDMNGIGYEVIMKALSDPRLYEDKTIIIYGSPKAASYYKKVYALNTFTFNQIQKASDAAAGKVNLIACTDPNAKVEVGKLTEDAGKASLDALEAAVKDVKAGLVDVLVTCPINKENITQAGFKFPGHTEYLSEHFSQSKELMLMVSDIMKVGVLTGHIPLAQVPGRITEDSVLEKIKILSNTLRMDFTCTNPRIAVLGLNPHAGDHGVIGDEDDKILAPAIAKANSMGMVAAGPYAADGFFGSSEYKKFDAILAMYHDQGLVPFKAMSFDTGVNYTAGLSIVRTSPGHGTAFDIAGQGVASEASFREAIYLAVDIYVQRAANKELNSNRLVTQELPEGQ